MLTTTGFPEIVDTVEKSAYYHQYDKEEVNIYVSSFFVLLVATANAIGTFCGSFTADLIGYTWAFSCGGIFLIGFAAVYAVACGPGEHLQDEEQHTRSALQGSKDAE